LFVFFFKGGGGVLFLLFSAFIFSSFDFIFLFSSLCLLSVIADGKIISS